MDLTTLFLAYLTFHQYAVAQNATDQLPVFAYNCSDSKNSTPQRASSLYQYNLYNLLGNFTSHATSIGFYNASLGEIPNRVYGLYMCQGDTNAESCSDCVNKVRDLIVKACPYQTDATFWHKGYLMRYSRHSFFGKMEVYPWSNITSPQNISEKQVAYFNTGARKALTDFAVVTANDGSPGKKYKTKVLNVSGFGNLYMMEQCTPDLTVADCRSCLSVAIERVAISVSAHSLLPSCAVWYQTTPFFNSTAEKSYPFFNSSSVAQPPFPNKSITSSPTGSSSSHGKLIAAIVSVSASISVTILLAFGVCIWRRKKTAAERTSGLQMEEIKTMESLHFDLNAIRVATRNFSMDNKLGEGGFGAVYKGVLDDGQVVALKRLSTDSRQGIAEFKTEVLLLAKLQHKNLVKLLGYCLASEEKILVYEYLQNSSVDRFLFDRQNNLSPDWDTRFKIILGIARGLLYLHEDSRLKIIHRDLKSSNVLLDEDMNPKISDFGLARLIEMDQTQGDTKRIVGTYGYMAPEYAMTGHFSVRSDVYSFGMIVLEIISSQKIGSLGTYDVEDTLVFCAWRLWNENTALELVDTALGENYPREEATKCIHIALLCIQYLAVQRPKMTSIVATLNGESISLPMPKTPHFIYDPTNVELPTIQYKQLMDGNQIEFPAIVIEKGTSYVYTGMENITEPYPR